MSGRSAHSSAAARHIDAVANRCAEGLRTLEDAARFWFDDERLTHQCKELRHRLRHAVPASVLGGRDVDGDVLAEVPSPSPRRTACDVLRANAARVQEAARSLSEIAAISLPELAAVAESVRYAVYGLEMRLLARVPAWRMWGVRLYVLVDPQWCSDPVAVAAAAARGGAGCVQLRAKKLAPAAYAELAKRTQDAVRTAGALFTVNDHVAVAAAIDADGIHVGQDDLPLALVRAAVGPLCAIGASCHSADQVDAAQAQGADVLGLGPMFATASKPQEPERGAVLLDAVRGRLNRPSFAIGGLDAQRIAALRPRIPHGVAVSAAVCQAADPERAAAEILALMQDPAE